MNDHDSTFRTQQAAFPATRWSVVLGAQGRSSGNPAASLESLCRQYWPPLYAYVRQRGHSRHDAQDLTQEFFARLLDKKWLAAADPAQGRLRTFLLMAMKRFLANEWDRSMTVKRGGGVEFVNLDPEDEDRFCDRAGPVGLPEESRFDREWALILMAAVMRRLEEEFQTAGQGAKFQALKATLTAGRGETDYGALAVTLATNPATARSSVHRLRKRFREIFREEVERTVAKPDEVDDEMRAIIAALGNAL